MSEIELSGEERVVVNQVPLISPSTGLNTDIISRDLASTLKSTSLKELNSNLQQSARRLGQNGTLSSAVVFVVPDPVIDGMQTIQVRANPILNRFSAKGSIAASSDGRDGEGTFEAKIANINGRGLSAAASCSHGLSNQQSWSISLNNPRLLDRDLALNLSLSRQLADFTHASSFIETEHTATATVQPLHFDDVHRPSHAFSLSVSRSMQHPSCRPTSSGLSPVPSEAYVLFDRFDSTHVSNFSIIDQAGESSRVAMWHRFSDDVRDSASLPTRGRVFTAVTVGLHHVCQV